MSLTGRFRAALGRDDASLLARARRDVQLGLDLNPPACLPPLNRAIAALERLPNSPEVALLLGKALSAKAQTLHGKAARDMRARSVAKLRAMIEERFLSVTDRAALWAALAQAWMPLPEDAEDADLCFRQLRRAQEAQTEALIVPTAPAHLVMAEICLALASNAVTPAPAEMAVLVQDHLNAARGLTPTPDDEARADALEAALSHRFSGLRPR